MKKESVTSVGAAVFLALYGMPHVVFAQQTSAEDTSSSTGPVELAEITVTANRREQTLEAVPYSMSVVSAEQLDRDRRDRLGLACDRSAGPEHVRVRRAFVRAPWPIIRGVNATGEPTRGFRTFEQAPVGTYIGNSPIDGYYQLDDLKQVEVLRGPQGTLYGAGTLAGAMRSFPTRRSSTRSRGQLEARRATRSLRTAPVHLKGMINIPLGETLAFRGSGQVQPTSRGSSNLRVVCQNANNGFSGIPVLANPADPVTSPGIYQDKSDWNFQKTFTGAGELPWEAGR